MLAEENRRRIAIEGVAPEIECGRFPVKRIVGDTVVVEADLLAEGHDALGAVLLYRREEDRQWAETPMRPLGNDRWQGSFVVQGLGVYRFTLQAWVDDFVSWREALRKKREAGQEISVDLKIGAQFIDKSLSRAQGQDLASLAEWAEALRSGGARGVSLALGDELAAVMARYPDKAFSTFYHQELAVAVDREKARYSAWYELFPRSWGHSPGRHGTFAEGEECLKYVASLGFDVLYLPPIHPIGKKNRKGPNNARSARPADPGSPWGIGAQEEGGHKAVHPLLGTLEDFRRFISRAADYGLEVALDLAFQCAPDHPYVKDHPEWFRRRPDGTVQYAENPPKKYEDIYPFDFATEAWRELWQELKDVVLFWIGQGVRIFRVDNPHTKPFRFWQWLIGEVKREYPEVIFLSEAFTRQKIMFHLAKLGFTQSYTYFAWRNTKEELTAYFTELTRRQIREFFRPHLWPNTPDILTEYLQTGGRPAFMARLILAATLGAGYGIYGPAFELIEDRPVETGSEEYLNSEKYEIRRWDLEAPRSLRALITRINRIRRQNPALHADDLLAFHGIENPELLCYSKRTADLSNVIITVVNLDPRHRQGGWIELPLGAFGLGPRETYQVHDLLSDTRFFWHGDRNYIELDPAVMPASIFRLRRRVRTEKDFDYYQ